MGKFNAFHVGHRFLIEEAKRRCPKVKVISIRGKGRELFSKREREEILKELGVEFVEIPFGEVKELSPRDFFLLLKEMGCSVLVVGKDWRFGKGRCAGVKEAMELGREFGIEVIPVEPLTLNGEKVGTSKIFELLKEGKVEDANRLLGFPYFVIGKVVEGKKLGRRLGFPTLNLEVGRELPLKRGVYLVEIAFNGNKFFGLANYGVRPTVSEERKPTLEVHVPGREFPPLYGRKVKVSFLSFLRPELKFKGVEELKEQIKLDLRKFKKLLEERVGRTE